MAISNKLVSKFVKATKTDTKNNRKEKIVYGSIVRKNDVDIYAKVDGADDNTLIPISRIASGVKDGEKVIITIKDHSAIVTGNVDNPSVDSSQVTGKIEEAVAGIEKTSSIAIADIQALWESNE